MRGAIDGPVPADCLCQHLLHDLLKQGRGVRRLKHLSGHGGEQRDVWLVLLVGLRNDLLNMLHAVYSARVPHALDLLHRHFFHLFEESRL